MLVHAARSLAFRLSVVAGMTMASIIALFAPSRICTADEADSAAAKRAAPVETLKDVAAKLKEAAGADWHLYTMPAGSAPRHLLWINLPTWYNRAAHYEILAASPADQVGKPPAEQGALALEVIATNGRYTVVSGPDFEPETAAKILAALGMTLSKELAKDAEQRRLKESSALWLDFRCAAARSSSQEDQKPLPLAHGPTPQEIESYSKLFAEKGPNGGRQRGDPYFWLGVLGCCDVSPLLYSKTDRGIYVLLSDKPNEVLLSGSKRPRPWHLKQVEATRDAQGRPAVELQFDETAAAGMARLTKANRGRALATLFFDEVLHIQVIDGEKMVTKQYRTGRTDFNDLKAVRRDWMEARLDAAETPSQRIAALEGFQKSNQELVEMVEVRFKNGQCSEAEFDWAKALLLDVRIKLLRARQAAGAEK